MDTWERRTRDRRDNPVFLKRLHAWNLLDIPRGLSRPVDKGIQVILSAWVSNGLPVWSKRDEAGKAFRLVRAGMKNCRGISQNRVTGLCKMGCESQQGGKKAQLHWLSSPSPTLPCRKQIWVCKSCFHTKIFSSKAVRKIGWNVRDTGKGLENKEGHIDMLPCCLPIYPMSSTGALVSKKSQQSQQKFEEGKSSSEQWRPGKWGGKGLPNEFISHPSHHEGAEVVLQNSQST